MFFVDLLLPEKQKRAMHSHYKCNISLLCSIILYFSNTFWLISQYVRTQYPAVQASIQPLLGRCLLVPVVVVATNMCTCIRIYGDTCDGWVKTLLYKCKVTRCVAACVFQTDLIRHRHLYVFLSIALKPSTCPVWQM